MIEMKHLFSPIMRKREVLLKKILDMVFCVHLLDRCIVLVITKL